MTQIPQLHPVTGISRDYINEYAPLFQILIQGLDKVFELVEERPIQKYSERFKEYMHLNLINEKNLEAVQRLDEIADSSNITFRDKGKLTEKLVRETVSEVQFLVYGRNF